MKMDLRKFGSGTVFALWIASLGACSTATEWLNEDPAAGAEKPAGPGAREIIASLGSEQAAPPAKPESEAAPEPVAERPSGEEVSENEDKTPAKTWKGWFGGAEKAEEPEAPEVAAETAEPQGSGEPGEVEPPAKPEPSGPEVDISKLDLSGDFPMASKLKDREGYVLSPYDGRTINVKGIASGSLVADPRFPLEERKYFKVP